MRVRQMPKRPRGAALLVLVAVVGLGMASVLVSALGKADLEGARARRTLATLTQAREALIGFAAVNGRLPRPATSPLDGRETSRPCASEAACNGFLPWVTLGVEQADSWGKLLRYSVTPSFTRAPIVRADAVASKTVQTRDERGALQYVVGQSDCNVGGCAALVLYSSGKNNFGTSVAGRRQANSGSNNMDERSNDSTARSFISRPPAGDAAQPGGSFDDIVVWVPQGTLFGRLNATGRLH